MIVRGFIAPRRGPDDRPSQSRFISSQEGVELYKQYKRVIEYLLWEFKEKNGPLQDAGDVNAFLNFLVLFLRSALYVDIVPGIMPATAGQAHRYFLHQLNRIRKGYRLDLSPKSYFKWLSERTQEHADEEFIKKEEELRKEIRAIFDFPADSRPGANTSSLLVHTLTASGIACSRYLGKGEGKLDRELAILRLTCLFHDLGKPYDWHRHEEIASEDLVKLFEGFVQGDAKDIVNEAAGLILRDVKTEAPFTELKRLYLDADRAASNIDRISAYFLRTLSENLKERLLQKAREYLKVPSVDEETFMKKCYNDWDFWDRHVPIEEKIKLTEDFCRYASRLSRDNLFLVRFNEEAVKPPPGVRGVEVVRFDVRGIQEFIKVNDLRAMAGASLIIDFAISVALPLALMFKAELPAESILYFGGGNIFVLLPSSIAQKIIDMAIGEIKEECGLSLTTAHQEILSSFAETNRRLEAEIIKRKLSEEGHASQLMKERPYGLNVFDLCDACGSRPPSKQQEEGKLYCGLCSERREVGDNFHMIYKLTRLGYKEDIPRYLKNMVEYIAGASEEEVRAGRFKEYKNLAVLRLDANVVGAFMGSSVSITDAFERSVRIDYSLKKAYNEFLNMVKGLDKATYDRLVLGAIYMGGDDAFLLAPSKISPYLAAFLINEFYLEMGSRLTLSCGIAVAKPKHPLIPLYEAAGYLLDGVAKKGARQEAYSKYGILGFDEEHDKRFRGSLAFYTIDGGFMAPENLEETLKWLYDRGISRQYREPYAISDVGSGGYRGSFLKLLQPISLALYGREDGGYSLHGLRGAVERDLRALLMDQKAPEKVKDLIATIKRDVDIELLGDRSIRLQIIFARRQAERLEDKRELISGLLQTLEVKDNDLRFGIADSLLLAKVVLGE